MLDWLKEHGQLERRESYRHSVGTCERCHSRIEPLVSPQWWCRMDELGARRSRRSTRGASGTTRRASTGSRSSRSSRRPTGASRASSGGGTRSPSGRAPTVTARARGRLPTSCAECGSAELERDPDVLDTWFSSALWPLATLGWPEQTPELDRYYPGDVNVTAREIIRLWENRMIFSGLFLLGDMPFTDVIITSTVLAADGRRMSKSLGTGIDPLEAVDKHGADATRYGLLKISSTQDVRFSWGAIEEGRKLANKLWNVVAPDPPERSGVDARAAAASRRGAVAARAARRDPGAGRGALGALRVLGRGERPLPPHLRRLLRLVRRGDQAAAVRRRQGRARDGAGRAGAAARAPAPGACRT